MTTVYQTPTHGYTPKAVADEFAKNFFDKPRKVARMSGNKFSLVGGVAEYEIQTVKGQRLVSNDTYIVVRLA